MVLVPSSIKSGFRSGGIRIKEGSGTPTHTGHIGELYIKLDAEGTTDRLWINVDGGVTWAYFTTSV